MQGAAATAAPALINPPGPPPGPTVTLKADFARAWSERSGQYKDEQRAPGARLALQRVEHYEEAQREYSRRNRLPEILQADGVNWIITSSRAIASKRAPARRRGAGRPAGRGSARRSSARSGDSGSDEPGEPEPHPACKRCGAELLTPARFCGFCVLEVDGRQPRACAICGTDISARRSDADTCCNAHKQRLKRSRRIEREKAASAAKIPRVPEKSPLAGVSRDVFECVYGNAANTARRALPERPWRGENGAQPYRAPVKRRQQIDLLFFDGDPELMADCFRMGDAPEAEFEKALAEARRDRDLSRANVIRHLDLLRDRDRVVVHLDYARVRRGHAVAA
jgi:hypothetical protein